jgi:hypothetical protein
MRSLLARGIGGLLLSGRAGAARGSHPAPPAAAAAHRAAARRMATGVSAEGAEAGGGGKRVLRGVVFDMDGTLTVGLAARRGGGRGGWIAARTRRAGLQGRELAASVWASWLCCLPSLSESSRCGAVSSGERSRAVGAAASLPRKRRAPPLRCR